MCLAIVKPRRRTVPHEHIKNGFLNNSDGAGMAWAESGQLYVSKGFFNVESFITEYEQHKHRPMLLHFRLATHGAVSVDNCHPWQFCEGRLAMIHNGIFHIDTDRNESDTGAFVRTWLEPILMGRSPHKRTVRDMIEQKVGDFNKIAIMDNLGQFSILNERHGQWVNGVWYSNGDYQSSWRNLYHPREYEDWRIEWKTSSRYRLPPFRTGTFEYDKETNTCKRIANITCWHCKAVLDDVSQFLEDDGAVCPYCLEPLAVIDRSGL